MVMVGVGLAVEVTVWLLIGLQLCNSSGQVVHPFAAVTKQYNLVLISGAAANIIIGVAHTGHVLHTSATMIQPT